MNRLLAISVLAAGFSMGCASQGPWETARPSCLDYANASARAAQDAGHPAGIIVVTLRGTDVRHALTWVIANGKQYFWDGAWRTYRKTSDFTTVHRVVEGQSKGSYDYIKGKSNTSCPVEVYGQ